MKKSLELLKEEFESSPFRTQQYLNFHRVFKKEFTALLKNLHCEDIQFRKPNHFDVTGNFTKDNQPWYFSFGDLRGTNNEMMVRRVRDYKDYTGQSNQWVTIKNLEDGLRRVI